MTLDGASYALDGAARRSRARRDRIGLAVTGLEPLRWIRGTARRHRHSPHRRRDRRAR